MTTDKAIEMIDEYLLEPNSISKEWIECMRLCRQALLENESQKEQINGLIAGQETLMTYIARKKERIAGLENEVERLQKEGLILNKTFMDFVNNEKSEAIKEFAERLPQYIPHFDNGYTTMQCVEGAIDHLVKEMVGTRADTSVSLVDGHVENDFDNRAFWEDTH